MNGIELIKYIKSNKVFNFIKIIVMSSDETYEER